MHLIGFSLFILKSDMFNRAGSNIHCLLTGILHDLIHVSILYTCQCLATFRHPNTWSLPQIFCFLFSLLTELKIQLQRLYLIISDICIPRTRIYQRLRSTKTLFQASVSKVSKCIWTYRTLCECINFKLSNWCLFRQLFY